jgi:hypothetical protein
MTSTTETETWTPSFAPWRHGGWYVTNVRYPSGAVGCVSRNYSDGKWRIVCRPGSGPGEPDDLTFPSRDAAARAERELADTRKCLYCGHSGPSAEFTSFNHSHAGNLSCKRLTDCVRRQAENAGWDDRLRVMAAQLRDESGADGRCFLADRIEAELGQDYDTSAMLAAAYWGITS